MDFRDHLVFAEKQIAQAEAPSSSLLDISLYLIPSILLSWIAIEAFVNSVIDDLNQVPPDLFFLHEKAFLLEKKVTFCEKGKQLGKFMIDRASEYHRLEDKIFFSSQNLARWMMILKVRNYGRNLRSLRRIGTT